MNYEAQIRDAVRFSNFCQKVKMAYWSGHPESPGEAELDKVLLLAWEEYAERENSMFDGIRRWAEMAEKEDWVKFSDTGFIGSDELTASIQSYALGNDIKYHDPS